VLTAVPELVVGYLLVCGRGLLSFDLPSLPTVGGLSVRSGVDWLPLLLEPLCRRVFSNSQWVQFFQWARMAWEDRFFTFFCSFAWELPFVVNASLVVTRWSVEPLERALRRTPSLGGGIGLRCLDVLTDLMESLSMGGGGISLSGLKLPFAVLASSAKTGRSGIMRLG
jgi:hypothetical protein